MERRPRQLLIAWVTLAIGTVGAAYFSALKDWYEITDLGFFTNSTYTVPGSGPLGAFDWQWMPLLIAGLAAVAVLALAGVAGIRGRQTRLDRVAAAILAVLALVAVGVLLYELVYCPDLRSLATPSYGGEFKRFEMHVTGAFLGGLGSYLLILGSSAYLALGGGTAPTDSAAGSPP